MTKQKYSFNSIERIIWKIQSKDDLLIANEFIKQGDATESYSCPLPMKMASLWPGPAPVLPTTVLSNQQQLEAHLQLALENNAANDASKSQASTNQVIQQETVKMRNFSINVLYPCSLAETHYSPP